MFFLTVIPFRRSNHISTFLRFIEYTCLAFASIEVLLYIFEPRIPCNDVFSKCWIVESNTVGAWVLLKLYISSSPIFVIHCSLWINHSLSPHKICIYHRHPCSTQQQFQTLMINSWIFVVLSCFPPFPHNFPKSCANFVSQGSKVQRFVWVIGIFSSYSCEI